MSNETTRIASTNLLGLVPLGSRGDRGHGRLFDSLSARFGVRHAALLADPEPLADGSAVDWYVPGHVKATPFADLPAPDAAKFEQELTRLTNDIRAFAKELDQPKRGGPDRSLAEALRNALQIPGPEYIYAVGDQPVLVAWAYHKQEALPFDVGLVRIADVAPKQPFKPAALPPPIADSIRPVPPSLSVVPASARQSETRMSPAVMAARRPFPWHWLLWLLFALLVAAILAILLRACAINLVRTWYPGLAWCGRVSSIVQEDAGQISDLQRLIDNLQLQLGRRIAECPAGRLQLPASQSAQPPSTSDIEKRVEDNKGVKGELNISLGWPGTADLDLYVACADNKAVYFKEKSNCGGNLQIDMNHESRSTQPVEDVVFPSISDIPAGMLKVGVGWYADQGEQRTTLPATIIVRRSGQIIAQKRIDVQRPSRTPGEPNFYLEIPVPR
ncbi:hypothetical protein HL666_20025 [Bradyrhizobium sp. 83002]|uniref:hypothetical protein n=1 Tax=Bradyrhizobium aeschynomenes TaxID=2734909 RepID=UPI00155792CB|nr:hypothetical protein [Bradyrhizobium aeschynomenes]NPU13061.1 hypothetical protein [Bradyrhizobium aeschynomenes]